MTGSFGGNKMNDLELIGLAAKACGFTVYNINSAGAMIEGSAHIRWNPLVDCNLCTIMGLKLNLSISYKDPQFAGMTGECLYLAINRAMTVAAADIGKMM